MVKSGIKTQIIRKERKRPIKIGDKLYLYSGSRTKNVEKLGEGICIDLTPISIEYGIVYYNDIISPVFEGKELEELAKKDGFNKIEDFFLWFKSHYGNYFKGVVIEWKLI